MPRNSESLENLSSDESQSEKTSNWTNKQKLELLKLISKQIPENDNISYDERIEIIDWKKIRIAGKYSYEAKEQFQKYLEGMRSFRVLPEILLDVHDKLFSDFKLGRPLGAFSLFLKENKHKIKCVEGSRLTQAAAAYYKNLTAEERKSYVDRSAQMQIKYRNIKKQFDLTNSIKKKPSTRKSKKKLKELNVDERRVIVDYYWKTLNKKGNMVSFKDAKISYNNLDNNDKQKLILDFLNVSSDQTKLSLSQYQNATKYLLKIELDLLDDFEGRPKKETAYNLFLKDKLCKGQKKDNNIAGEWKKLSKEKQRYYVEKVKSLNEQYNSDYLKFIKSLEPKRQCHEFKNVLKEDLKRKARKSKADARNHKKNDTEISDFDSSKDEDEEGTKSDFSSSSSESFKRPESPYKRKLRNKSVSESTQSDIVPSIKKSNLENNSNTTELESKKSKERRDALNHLKSKPPETLYNFFLKCVYDGPQNNAKKAYKRLAPKEKDVIEKQYRKTKRKYLKELNHHKKNLTRDEIMEYAEVTWESVHES